MTARSAGLMLMLTACRPAQAPAPRPITALPVALAAPAGPVEGMWRFEVAAGAGAAELRVEALFPPHTPTELGVDPGGEGFVRDVEVGAGGTWVPVKAAGKTWQVAACAGGCRLRYRYLLGEAAEHFDEVDEAMETGGALFATPPIWVLRPKEAVDDVRARLHVSVPAGSSFVTGIFPSADGAADTYEADTDALDNAPYSGFGAFRRRSPAVPGGQLEVAIVPAPFALSDDEITEWAVRSAGMIAAYFGGFPVPRLALFVAPMGRGGIGLGTTMGHGGAAIVVFVGREATKAELLDDWVLPHEMIHLAMSQLARRHRWLKEGIATYVEPVAEAQAGRSTAKEVWSGFVDHMENGLPGWRDRGLDNTPTWGRVYWGGALFCLLADIEIRQRTGNGRSLRDAFRAIVKAGGNIASDRDIEQLLADGDRGTGVQVLTELYGQMANQPVPVDLPALWRRLGVVRQGDSVRFDEQAPLAAVRRAITSPTDRDRGAGDDSRR